MRSPTATGSATSSGEVFGARFLYAAVVIGAALLLAGAIWQPAPQAAAPVQQAQATLNAAG
jgi:hypothetical protein